VTIANSFSPSTKFLIPIEGKLLNSSVANHCYATASPIADHGVATDTGTVSRFIAIALLAWKT
jgi:hypothetical protein